MKSNYRAYHQGVRSYRFWNGKGSYYHNPFKYQTSEWYSFNIGWNDALLNRVVK